MTYASSAQQCAAIPECKLPSWSTYALPEPASGADTCTRPAPWAECLPADLLGSQVDCGGLQAVAVPASCQMWAALEGPAPPAAPLAHPLEAPPGLVPHTPRCGT